MNLKDFYYFLDLSQQQSFTGVAQKHGISQPSVSYAVKRLEKEFHCQLIAHDPSHRTFKLTPQGEILLRHIHKILPEIQGAKKEILRSLSQFNTIGFPPIIIDYLVRKQPAFISNVAALQSIHPVQEGSVELLEMLSKGELDASFLGSLEPIKDHRFQVREMAKRDLFYILHHNHPLASKKVLQFSDVIDEDFIIPDEHFVHLKAFEQLNERYHHEATPFFQTDDIQLLKQLLRKQVGISLLADLALTDGEEELIAIPMAENERISFYVSLVEPKESNLKPEVIQFFEKLLN